MKMGTTASLWRYDAAACRALQSAKLRLPAIPHDISWASRQVGPAPLFLPTGLFQQARNFVHPMPVTQPEWSQGVGGKLFQLAHLIDA